MNFDKLKGDVRLPKHLALIIDGNGRWAKRRGLPRSVGHKAGADNIRKHIEYVYNLGIKNLSVFAFSCENFNRPQKEVDYLMELFEKLLDDYINNYSDKDIKFVVSGDLEDYRIPDAVRNKANTLMQTTKAKNRMVVNICINYGGKQDIVRAVNEMIKQGKADINTSDIESHLYTHDLLPLDFVIRTSGEVRLSNFMLWQSAYSELCFYKKPWPSFSKRDLVKCLLDYIKRERRFGGIKE